MSHIREEGNRLHVDFHYCCITAVVAVSASKKSPRVRRALVRLILVFVTLVVSLAQLLDKGPRGGISISEIDLRPDKMSAKEFFVLGHCTDVDKGIKEARHGRAIDGG